jgi:hypothetical protein
MPINTKQIDFTKPFQFRAYEGTFQYTCKGLNEDGVLVITVQSGEDLPCSLESVKRFIANGDWKPVFRTNENTQQEDAMTSLEEYIKAINKNVPEATTEQPEGCAWCECPDCKAAFSEAPDNTLCDFCDEYGHDCTEPQETMLEAIKDFTISTGASVFIDGGEYEIFFGDFDNPFKAATDAEMWRLMEAIGVLQGAI